MTTSDVSSHQLKDGMIEPDSKPLDISALSAKAVWSLYREHGLGRFANWLSMKYDNIDRQEVVQALRFPETRKAAENLIAHYRVKIQEIESILAESESA